MLHYVLHLISQNHNKFCLNFHFHGLKSFKHKIFSMHIKNMWTRVRINVSKMNSQKSCSLFWNTECSLSLQFSFRLHFSLWRLPFDHESNWVWLNLKASIIIQWYLEQFVIVIEPFQIDMYTIIIIIIQSKCIGTIHQFRSEFQVDA